MIKHPNSISLAVAALAALLALTGCSAAPTQAPATATPSLEAEPTETPEPEVTFEVGQTLDSEEAAEQAREAGLGTYTFEDGTIIVVDPHAPLPESVVAEIKAVVGDTLTTVHATHDEAAAGPSGYTIATEKAGTTGKVLVMVAVIKLYDVDGSLLDHSYGFVTSPTTLYGENFETPDEALADAQAQVAATDDPSIYEIIDFNR